jgi:hypothetical protein
MKRIIPIIAVCVLAFVFSCTKSKPMAPEDFIKIQTDYLSSDQTEEAKEASAKKFGFTAKQYDEFEEKVESDIELKTKVGEIRIKNQK